MVYVICPTCDHLVNKRAPAENRQYKPIACGQVLLLPSTTSEADHESCVNYNPRYIEKAVPKFE